MDTNITLQEQDGEVGADLKKASLPLIKYLCENHHPHTHAVVTGTSVEVFEGTIRLSEINDFLVD